jgi:NAD(P)-dependent dehydrogenase (short-subunit alcohol dehydrogenase family)
MLSGDVADSHFCSSAIEKTIAEFGKLDILVNNAAFQEHAGDITDISDRQGHTSQRSFARPCVDSPQPQRQATE